MYDRSTYKPHWLRRQGKRETEAPTKCAFDRIVEIFIALIPFGMMLWIFLDAFNWFYIF